MDFAMVISLKLVQQRLNRRIASFRIRSYRPGSRSQLAATVNACVSLQVDRDNYSSQA
jgi:hypothetical protein